MYMNLFDFIGNEFEKTYLSAIAKAASVKAPTSLYLSAGGAKIKLPKSLGSHWNKTGLTVTGCATVHYSRSKVLNFDTYDVTVDLLNTDPETVRFIIEEQGYTPVIRQKILPVKLREAIKTARVLSAERLTAAAAD